MSTLRPRLDATTFDQLYGHHGTKVKAALRSVLVDGWQVAKAARAHGVARSGLYRSMSTQGATPASLEAVSVLCPVHRAGQLRTLISRQLAIWAEKDAGATLAKPSEPAPTTEGRKP